MVTSRIDDEPDDGTPTDTGISRRGFNKATLGVAAVAGGLGVSGVSGLLDESPAAAHGNPNERSILGIFEARPLDGSGNNRAHPSWGAANTIYPRVAPSAYLDGIAQSPDGPNARYISNRIFNDTNVTLYSSRNISMWGFVWGQFLDHTFALRLGRRQTGEDGDVADIPTDDADPLEQFPNPLGVVFMNRSIPAAGTGETSPREQLNQVNSYVDAAAVYSNDEARLSWMREGPGDGNPKHSRARLMMSEGDYLPRRNARGDADAAPSMVIGAMPDPGLAAVAGDQRANENPMILATQTLFAREHNRIVGRLPTWMSEEDRFQIARAVVIAEQQYITYHEFLPAMGVTLPRYTGYKPSVDPSITNEFATIGYRGHSMINRVLAVQTEARRYSPETVDWLRSLDINVTYHGNQVRVVAPHGFNTFFQPDLIERLGLGPVLQGISRVPMCENDELVSNMIRSLVAPGAVNDLAAVDVARGRDHGFPGYNGVRRVYGLAPKRSFRDITGEDTEEFPRDPKLVRGNEINDPHCLDYVRLYDIHGRPTTPQADNAVRGVRRTTLAARLKAIYHQVDRVDPFVGMICERHLPGSNFGELQLAMWQRQFTALRDGDRFFYLNYPLLNYVRSHFGIGYETTLAELIARNTDIAPHDLPKNAFFADHQLDASDPDLPNGAPVGHAHGVAATEAVPAVALAADPTARGEWYCGRAEV